MNLISGKNRLVMTILLTGSNGFLGKTILDVLEQEHHFFTLSRSAGNYQLNLDKQIPDFQQKFDLVIHVAGKAHSVPKTDAEKKEFHQVNVVGTENLLKGLENSGIPAQFVFISSVAVYGQETGIAISEDFLLDAKDAYGLSKIEGEKVILEWCKKNNVICTILRLPLLVGQNPPGNLGSMMNAIKKGFYFNIGGGIAKKSMVLTKDVAKIILVAAPKGGVFNLTDRVHPTFNELSVILASNQNKKSPLNMPLFIAKLIGLIGDVLGDKVPINTNKVKKITSDLTFDDSNAIHKLNWKPEPVLDFLRRENLL